MSPWAGGLPNEWRTSRLKWVTQLINQKTERTDRPYLGLENVESGTGRWLPSRSEAEPEGLANLFEQRDVLFGKLRPYLAKVYMAEWPGRCTSEMLVLRPHEVLPEFLRFVMLADETTKLVDSSTYGAKMPRAEWDFVGRLVVPVPAKNRQRAIAVFLDRKTAAIDALIAKKERLIELLREKRQALITQAVTKGIDPNVRMKDSGIHWLGEVPAHWIVEKLRRISSRVDVGIAEAATHAYASEGVPLIRSTNIVNGTFDRVSVLFIEPWFAQRNRSKTLRSGDIVTVRTGTPGISAVVPSEFDGAQCFTTLMTTLLAGHHSHYVCEYLNSKAGRTYFELESWGSAQQNISVPILADIPVPVPPVAEQRRIVDWIEREAGTLDRTISQVVRQAELLREYRQALISAAVTGKIEIPSEVAA